MDQKPEISEALQNPEIQEQDELTAYSFDELLNLNTRLQAEIQRRQVQELESHREKTLALANALNMSIEQMFGINQPKGRAGRKPRTDKGQPLPPKYRGPNGEEWSGKGLAPRWIRDSGKDKSEFLIQ